MLTIHKCDAGHEWGAWLWSRFWCDMRVRCPHCRKYATAIRAATEAEIAEAVTQRRLAQARAQDLRGAV